ncbi:glycoside hydrolase family 28 protein [Mucilaginibacter yixingensis]|nr:glycoside hydrolase family 28 protein [Mucilaginibacter yixingensis]
MTNNRLPKLMSSLFCKTAVFCAASLLALATMALKPDDSSTGKIPTADQVGADKLPDAIAPVKAPFPMPVFKKPVFPKFSLNIADRGAKKDAITTKEIQATIDEVSKRGGGTVIIPAGAWKTGRIALKSNVNLHLDEGAELQFSADVEDYRPAVFSLSEGVEVMSLGAMIYANEQQNIAVTGKGKIIGPGDGTVKRQVMKGGVVENVVSANKPVAERVYEGYNGSPIFLPMCISPINCKNVYIEGVTINNTLFWNIVPIYCDGVIIRGITVNSTGNGRTDGIDVQSSRNVLVEYCTLSNGDDCFTIKGGRNEDGMRVNRPCENIVVRYCLSKKGVGAVTCGSETAGMIRNLYVHDCVFNGTSVGMSFKTRRPRGGGGDNLIYERIRLNVPGDAFRFDMLGGRAYVGELADRLPVRPINKLTPVYRNITAKDIVVDNANYFLNIKGIPESPVTNLKVENVEINCKSLIKASDLTNVLIKNTTVHTKDTLITVLDGRNITFDHVKIDNPNKQVTTLVDGPQADNIRFIDCTPAKPKNWAQASWLKK